ncbi:hypothetical protein ACOSQ2_023114 [Xanthoceras sorbifolium]
MGSASQGCQLPLPVGYSPSLPSLPPTFPAAGTSDEGRRKDKGKTIASETQLARMEQLTREVLFIVRGSQPNKVINLDAPEVTLSSSDWTLGPITMEFLKWASTIAGEFLTKGLSQHKEEDQGVRLRQFMLCYSLMLQTYKDELASKAELEKKLAEEAKMC